MIKIQIIYNNKNSALGVVQIIHGMSEHSKRYLEFAEFLNANRFIVILSDHRGHGEKALKNNSLGLFTG
ncbi:MAG: alpha/beta hydrolase, partial [Cetobacterium sp.]